MSDAPDSTGSAKGGDEAGSAVGRRLREARTRRKMGLEGVAKELHLDVSVISAIENDDRTSMPAPAFVQGYIRNYARLLELPEDELVRQYAAQCSEPPPLSVIGIGDHRKMPFLRMPSMRLLRTLILLMLDQMDWHLKRHLRCDLGCVVGASVIYDYDFIGQIAVRKRLTNSFQQLG